MAGPLPACMRTIIRSLLSGIEQAEITLKTAYRLNLVLKRSKLSKTPVMVKSLCAVYFFH